MCDDVCHIILNTWDVYGRLMTSITKMFKDQKGSGIICVLLSPLTSQDVHGRPIFTGLFEGKIKNADDYCSDNNIEVIRVMVMTKARKICA